MLFRSRSLYLALLGVGYVLIGALRASSEKGPGVAVTLALGPALMLVWMRSAPPARGEDWITPVSRSALRACGFGGALLAAAWVAPPGSAPFQMVAVAGCTFASVSSLVALSRIAPLGGMLAVPARAESLRTAFTMLFVGVVAIGICAARALAPEGPVGPLATELACSGAASISLFLSIVHPSRLRRLRRADLGAQERLSAAQKLAWAGLLIGVPASLLGTASASRALSLSAWAVAFGTLSACVMRDPERVGRAQRVLLVATLLAAPAALASALIARQRAHPVPFLAAMTLCAGLFFGLFALRLSRLLGARAGRWSEAIRDAVRATMRSEPEAAMAAALSTLRQAFGPKVPAPELWQLDPPQRMVVDLAGYVQVQAAEPLPKNLLDLAQAEPEQMLRTEVLERLEVRRADIRPPLEWMRSREALAVMVLSDEEGPIGALLLPRRGQAAPLRLEEVRALRALADRLATLLSVSAALRRSRARELDARQAADRHEDRALYLEHMLSIRGGIQDELASRVAHGALLAAYGPAARDAIAELERLGKLGAPVSLLTPPGIDPVPYAALVHRAAEGRSGPFVVVDAADARDRLLSTWTEPSTSPLSLSDGGTLCILAAAALPSETQLFLAAALGERRSPGSAAPLDLVVVASVASSVQELVARGQLEPSLAQRLGERTVSLPTWSTRPEDQRALLLDRMGRLGLRLRGRPMGFDPRALARLIEHEWPGNDVEVNDVLTRAAMVAAGDVVTSADLDHIGFAPTPAARRVPRGPYLVGS